MYSNVNDKNMMGTKAVGTKVMIAIYVVVTNMYCSLSFFFLLHTVVCLEKLSLYSSRSKVINYSVKNLNCGLDIGLLYINPV